METINEIINTALLTCTLAHDKPISVLLVGPSGGGKSLSLMRYKSPWIHHTNDMTTIGLHQLLGPDKQNKIRAIILPDFNIPLSHKPAVMTLTVANMLSLMSEGSLRIDDGRGEKTLEHKPIAFLSAVTPEMYRSNFRKWKNLGFLRRFLIINFNYEVKTRREGSRLIREGKITSGLLTEREIKNPPDPQTVSISSSNASEIENLSLELAKNLSYNIVRDYRADKVRWTISVDLALEFDPHLTLRAMVRAHALYRNSHTVEKADLGFIETLLRFTNPSQPGMI